jgi:hypothetical protein
MIQLLTYTTFQAWLPEAWADMETFARARNQSDPTKAKASRIAS